jgi:predicted CoA-binding protein
LGYRNIINRAKNSVFYDFLLKKILFRKPAIVDAVADACIKRGDVKVLWTQLEIINNKASQKAKDAGISVVQNYCAMVEHKAIFGQA